MTASASTPPATPDESGEPEKGPKQVLFACSWNATRSPMAAGLLNAKAGHCVTVRSAGVLGGRPVDPFAVEAMAELGHDIADHRPNSLTDIEAAGGDIGAFDLIIALSPAAGREAEAVGRLAGVAVEQWAIDDPTQADGSDDIRRAAYRSVRDALASAIDQRFSRCRAAEGSAGLKPRR